MSGVIVIKPLNLALLFSALLGFYWRSSSRRLIFRVSRNSARGLLGALLYSRSSNYAVRSMGPCVMIMRRFYRLTSNDRARPYGYYAHYLT